jgi:hypothetical protein
MTAPLITRTPMVDDDGSGEVGTVLNNAWKQELYNQIDALVSGAGGSADVITSATGGSSGAIAGTTQAPLHVVLLTNPGDIGVYQFSAPNSRAGDRLLFMSAGTGNVYLSHTDANTADRLSNVVTSGSTPLKSARGVAQYVRNAAGAWVMTAHQQGGAIVVPFAAGNFSASGGTWTVASGSGTLGYELHGAMLSFYITATGAVGGAPSTLNLLFPNGYTSGLPTATQAMYARLSGGTSLWTYANVFGTQLQVAGTINGGGWGADAATLIAGLVHVQII